MAIISINMAFTALRIPLVNPLIYTSADARITYTTAGEVVQRLGGIANNIRRIANNHGLKTDQCGKYFLDKLKCTDKWVDSLCYDQNGIETRHIIHVTQGV